MGGVDVVIRADAALTLTVTILSNGYCGSRTHGGWWYSGVNYNRHEWLACDLNRTFEVHLAAGQSWSYGMGTEIWNKNAAYGKNSSISMPLTAGYKLTIVATPH